VGGGELLSLRQVGETPNHLFPGAEDNREPSLAFDFLKPFDLHGVSSLCLFLAATDMPELPHHPVTATGKKRFVRTDGDLVLPRSQLIGGVTRGFPWHPSCFGPSQKHITHFTKTEDQMMKFLVGAVAGALAMWYWGDDLRDYLDNRTRDVRARAVEKLQTVEEKAGDVLDRAKEQVSSTLQAGQEAIRPRMS
jgi:hypothetical protein